MKTIGRFTIYSSAIAMFFALAFSAATQAADAGTGVVKGQINFCGNGGVDGMLVYVPGRQFSVVTGEDGNFIFDNLMPGEYRLKFKNGNRIFDFQNSVYVFSQRVNDLGVVALCDAVGTIISDTGASLPAVTVAPAPANAVQPTVSDAKMAGDSGCTEGTLVSLPGGTGDCKQGKLSVFSCNKGFSDCDGKVENGCEVDLMNDRENCGACGNECSSMDSCSLGIC